MNFRYRSIRGLLMGSAAILMSLAAGCASTGTTAKTAAGDAGKVEATKATKDGIVVMIGIDALRWDIIDREPAPNLNALAQRGVRAQGLIPVFPSLTFPNFYALATGLYAGHSGVLANETYDRDLDTLFGMSDGGDGRWFNGEPIWFTAERQGVRAATMFWIGSEAPDDAGEHQSFWMPYDHNRPHDDRVEQVLEWLRLPEAERPRLVMLYFSAVDSAGHHYGVGSPEEQAALLDVDAHVGTLLDGIRALGLDDQVNVIVVGDHGMTNLSPERVINADAFLSEEELAMSPQLRPGHGNSTSVSFVAPPEQAEAIYQKLALAHPKMTVYRRDQIPERFHYQNDARTPDVLVVPELGWVVSRSDVPFSTTYVASHGFDPANRDMHSAFIAAGPAFAQGAVVEPFEHVNVYSIVAYLLGLEPAETDGSLDNVRNVFRQKP